MILESHNTTIEQLIPLLDNENFDIIFGRLLEKESECIRFLVKMELHRRTAICVRKIDLTDQTELPCEAVVIGEFEHFIDEEHKKILLENWALYNKYTIGIYEKVMDNHEYLQESGQDNAIVSEEKEHPFIVPSVILGTSFNRKNEQINFNLKILVSQDKQTDIKGIMTDLSLNAAIIRLPLKHGLNFKNDLFITFSVLNENWELDYLKQPVEYKVFNYKQCPQFVIVRLKRVTAGQSLSNDLYQLSQQCIKKDKIDFSDVYHSTLGLALERLYLTHFPHLAAFITCENAEYSIQYLLKSQRNNLLINYFTDENKVNQLESMLTTERINLIINEPTNLSHQLVFCFFHTVDDKKLYFSATLSELNDNQHTNLFFNFGAAKSSWRVIKLVYNKIKPIASFKSSVLPGQNEKLNGNIENSLSQLSEIIQLIDCTNEAGKDIYLQWPATAVMDVNELKVYGQPKLPHESLQLCAMQFFNRIQEDRYKLHTLIELTQNKLKVDSLSEDISSKGFQVVLNNFVQFNPDELIYISLPRLQYLSESVKLEEIPYKIVNIRNNGMVLHLMANVTHEPHVGVEFIKSLIASNKNKLVAVSEEESDAKQLTDALKNILLNHLVSLPFFIEKNADSGSFSMVGVSKEPCELTRLFAIEQSVPLSFDLEPLFIANKDDFEKYILSEIKMMDDSMDMSWYEIFISVNTQGHRLVCSAADKIGDFKAQLAFIREAKEQGQFIGLRIYRGVAVKADFNHIRKELKYLSFYDYKSSEALKHKLKFLSGVGDIIDVTLEIETRFPELMAPSSNAIDNADIEDKEQDEKQQLALSDDKKAEDEVSS